MEDYIFWTVVVEIGDSLFNFFVSSIIMNILISRLQQMYEQEAQISRCDVMTK